MYLAISHSWQTLLAAFIPPAVGKSNLQLAFIAGSLVAATNQIGKTMIVGTAGTTSPWCDKITETAPGDTDVIGSRIDIEVAITTILEITMIYPHISTLLHGEIVLSIDIISSWSLEGKVAQDNILAVFDAEYTRIVCIASMCGIRQGRTRQSVNGLVGCILYIYLGIGCQRAAYIYGSLLCAFHGFQEFAHGRNEHRILIFRTRYLSTNITPSDRLVEIIFGESTDL